MGNLGGTGTAGPGNVGLQINNLSQVAGASNLPHDRNYHATLWTEERGLQDLKTLQGDVNSAGLGINDSGEVVGVSFDGEGDPRGFLWRNGVMTDLNTVVPATPPCFCCSHTA
jgi:probable HAF family extracellular repeat protein